MEKKWMVRITEKANPANVIEGKFETRQAAAAYAMRWKAGDARGWTPGRYVIEKPVEIEVEGTE